MEDLKPIIEKTLAPVFGPMTARKAVMAETGFVPDWKIRMAARNFLKKQLDLKKREKERTRVRQRDLDHEKFRGIVDARTG